MSGEAPPDLLRRARLLRNVLRELAAERPVDPEIGPEVELTEADPRGWPDPAPALVLRATYTSSPGPDGWAGELEAGIWTEGNALARVVLRGTDRPSRTLEPAAPGPRAAEAVWDEVKEAFVALLPPLLAGSDDPALQERLDELPPDGWSRRRWEPHFEVVRRDTGERSIRRRGSFSLEHVSVTRRVDHDHCLGCGATFSEAEEHLDEGMHHPEEGWLCPACHEQQTGRSSGGRADPGR